MVELVVVKVVVVVGVEDTSCGTISSGDGVEVTSCSTFSSGDGGSGGGSRRYKLWYN